MRGPGEQRRTRAKGTNWGQRKLAKTPPN